MDDQLTANNSEEPAMQIGDEVPAQGTDYTSLRQINILYGKNGVKRVEVLTSINHKAPDGTITPGEGTWSGTDVNDPLTAEVQAAITTIQNAFVPST